jgi:hypothetical protein
MDQALDALEEQIVRLRQAVREAAARRDPARVKELRAELRRAERAWDMLVSPPEPDGADEETEHVPSSAGQGQPAATSMLPVREQVHQALTLLGVPAAPKLISAVDAAFFTGMLAASKLTSLRRDEERSYRSAPGARPYYVCPALAHDHLSPARALLTVSTWPLEERIVGPLSPRVHFLTSAINVANAVATLRTTAEAGGDDGTPSPAERLLRQFAMNIPGTTAADPGISKGDLAADVLDPDQVRGAAEAELNIHADADRDTRIAAARRARRQLEDIEQLFGTPLKTIRGMVGQR